MFHAPVLSILLGVVGVVSSGYSSRNQDNKPARNFYKIEGIVAAPYLSATDASGRNTGAIIDILEAMKAESLGNSDYNLTVQRDNVDGNSVNGVNTGLIKDLVDGTIDMAAADTTVRLLATLLWTFCSLLYAVNFASPSTTSTGTSDPCLLSTYVLHSTTTQAFLRFDLPIGESVGVVHVVLQNSQNATLNNILKITLASSNIVSSDVDGIHSELSNHEHANAIK